MKRVLTSALLIILISCASFGYAKRLVAEGKSFTPLGNFKIETADEPVVINGVQLETYTISYENSDLTLTIAIENNKDCKKYITVSDKLSVQYVCYETHFGVEKLSIGNPSGFTTSDSEMNRNAYFHQRVLTPGKNDQVTCMKLIGAYFPELLSA